MLDFFRATNSQKHLLRSRVNNETLENLLNSLKLTPVLELGTPVLWSEVMTFRRLPENREIPGIRPLKDGLLSIFHCKSSRAISLARVKNRILNTALESYFTYLNCAENILSQIHMTEIELLLTLVQKL